MRSDLDDQLRRLGDWMEAETGEQLRPDLADLIVSTDEVALPGRRRIVLVAAATLAFVLGGAAVFLLVDRGSGPTAVVTPQTEAPTTPVTTTSTTLMPTTTTTEAPLAIDVDLAVETAETFIDRTLDGSESGWSVVVLDSATGELLARAGDEELIASAGSVMHIVPVAAAVAAGYDDGREIDGTGPCDGPNGEIRNFGNGGGSVRSLENQVTSASRCAMTALDQELRPSWMLDRAGLPHADDLIGELQFLEVAQLAELVRALTGDGMYLRPDGPVRLVVPATAETVRSFYESNVRAGTASRMLPPDGRTVAGVTGTNQDFVHSLAVLRSDELVIAAAIEDPDGANSGRNLTGGSFPAMLAGEIHAAVAPPVADTAIRPVIDGVVEPAVRPTLATCQLIRWGGGEGDHRTPGDAFRSLFETEELPLPRTDYLELVLGDGAVAYVPAASDLARSDVIIDVAESDGRWRVERWEQASC